MLRTVLPLAALVCGAAPAIAATQTTTTTYQYNADGALTAVTTQIDAQAPSTVYLTWDDFVPDATNPGTGTVLTANGNLVGVGPTPGSGYATQFQYDQRNRLTATTPGSGPSVAYSYYPASLMASSTLAGGDAVQFYYDVGAVPQVSNIEQASTATWSAYLGDTTYLSDGTEQTLCRPRKDVAGIYDAGQQSFSPQRYDPYGTTASSAAGGSTAAQSSTYDMQQNPFQYADEYKDPTWGGYYLRARWYLPEYQTFLERDPGDATHRYSYGGGNPVGNMDATGLRFTYGDISRSVNRFLQPVNKGLRGELLPLLPVYGQVVGGIQLLGNLPEVWHHPNFRTWASFSFLAASVAVEAIDSAPALDRAYGPVKAFGGRIGFDLGIGVGQTALVADRGRKLDVSAMFQSISYNASGVLWGRLAAGFGYRSHPFSSSDVENMLDDHIANGEPKSALVFRVRQPLHEGISGGEGETNVTFPALDLKRIGMFHEGLVAVSKERIWYSEVQQDGDNMVVRTYWDRQRENEDYGPSGFIKKMQKEPDTESQFQYVGTFGQRDIDEAFATAIPAGRRQAYYNRLFGYGTRQLTDYNFVSNNCQDYVARMVGIVQRP